MMCDQMSGFLHIFKCRNRSSVKVILRLKEWGCIWGMPTFCTTDSGPSFRNTFAEKAVKLGVRLEHNSAYNPVSQAAVKTGVGRLKH